MAHGFSLLLSVSLSCCPHPTLALLQYLRLALVLVCGKCNSNHFQSTTAEICPSLRHYDDPDEVGGGGHTDWECGHTCFVCVCGCLCVLSVCQTAKYTVRQAENSNASCGLLQSWQMQEAESSVFTRIV